MVKSEIIERIQSRLNNLGFDAVSDKTDLITEYAELLWDEITININWAYIPDKLMRVYIDMVCGEFLYDLYLKGDLKDLIPNKPSFNDVTSIKAGDMTLGVKFGNSQSDNLVALIDKLRNPRNLRYLLSIFRKSLK